MSGDQIPSLPGKWVHIFPCSEVMWSVYEIIHVCTAVVYEVKSDHGSNFSNLSNWKWEAWKNQPQYKYQLFHIYFTKMKSCELKLESETLSLKHLFHYTSGLSHFQKCCFILIPLKDSTKWRNFEMQNSRSKIKIKVSVA